MVGQLVLIQSIQPRVTRSGRVIAPAQRRAGRRVVSRATSRAFSSRGESSRSASSGPSRLPAKRPQLAIEVSSGIEQDDEEAGPSSRPVKRPKPSSVVAQREQLTLSSFTDPKISTFSEPSTPAFTTERKNVPASRIWQDFDNYNQGKVQSAIEGIKVELSNDLVSPRLAGIQKSVDVLLSLPKKHEFQPAIKSHQKDLNNRMVIKRDNLIWTMMARHPSQANVLMIGNLSQDEYTREEATLVCNSFVELLNHWPGDLSVLTKPAAGFKGGSQQSRLLTMACRHKVLPDKRIRCLVPTFYKANPSSKEAKKREHHFEIQLPCLHPTTYAQRIDRKRAGPRLLQHSSEIPELSDRYEFVSWDNRGAVKRSITKVPSEPGQPPSFASLLPSAEELPMDEADRESLEKGERLLRLYSATVTNQGGIIDTQACADMWNGLLEKYGGSIQIARGSSRGIFGGFDLLQVYPQYDSFCTRIAPGVMVERKLLEKDCRLPSIVVRSIDRAWCLDVEQAISDTWLIEGNILKAWIRGAEVADQMNRAIRDKENPPSVCSCTPEMASVQTHPCASCGQYRLCNELVSNEHDSRRVCKSCNSTLLQRPGNQVLTVMRSRLRNTLMKERNVSRGLITEAESNEMLEECERVLASMLPSREEALEADVSSGSAWKDRYTGNVYSVSADNTLSVRTHYDRPSIDATFPAWLTTRGYRIHCPENISPTTQALNLAKHIQVPAYLAMLCWYANRRIELEDKYGDEIHGTQARLELDRIETKMVRISKRLRVIRLTFGWTKFCRLEGKGKGRTQEDFNVDLAPLLSGTPQPELQQSIEKLDTHLNFASSGARMNWPESELFRIRRLSEDIMEYFDVQLRRGSDGCPYFACPESYPARWNWPIAFQLANERLERMTKYCNRHWPTYDTTETIFLECLFQVCVNRCILDRNDVNYEQKKRLKAKYKSLLGLPITIAYHDGLTFAVGHRHHGQGMFTGWPAKATSIEERFNLDGENNILIEPRTENFLKSDYDESSYPELKQIVLDINLPRDVYDKTVKPHSLSKRDVEDMTWDGKEVKVDLFEEAPGFFDSGLSWPGEEVPKEKPIAKYFTSTYFKQEAGGSGLPNTAGLPSQVS